MENELNLAFSQRWNSKAL